MVIKILMSVSILIMFAYFTWRAPRLASITIWSLVASVLLTAALLMWIPGVFSEKARWIALSVPLIWVGFQYWCYYDDSARRVSIGLIGLSLVCGVIVAVSEPLV